MLSDDINFGAYQLVTTNPYVTQNTNWTNTSKTLLDLSYNIFTVIQRLSVDLAADSDKFITLMMEAVRTSETSVYSNETT
jgi:hypothetical protein